jgi:hypothetical protein
MDTNEYKRKRVFMNATAKKTCTQFRMSSILKFFIHFN